MPKENRRSPLRASGEEALLYKKSPINRRIGLWEILFCPFAVGGGKSAELFDLGKERVARCLVFCKLLSFLKNDCLGSLSEEALV